MQQKTASKFNAYVLTRC